jgi:hypothetical protein
VALIIPFGFLAFVRSVWMIGMDRAYDLYILTNEVRYDL